MEYILRLKNMITEEQRRELCEFAEIIYESKFLPTLGVETISLEKIYSCNFVESIRLSRDGIYQDGDYLAVVLFQPPIPKRVLVNNQMTGWGSKIFILDSGVDERQISIQEQKDYTKKGRHDNIGHGTTIAKIIKHIAKGSQIYAARIGSPDPNEINLMRGIEWAIDKGANVINISSEFAKTPNCKGNCELCELVNFASSKGIAVVVAAGNSGQIDNSIVCPGIATDSITVGAVHMMKSGLAGYSSIGKPGGNKPNLIAPGQGNIDGNPFSGTSFSAPVVSGVIGALYSRTGDIRKTVEYIYSTCEDLKLPGHHQGLGCINLEKLVEVVNDEVPDFKGAGQVGI